MRVTVRLFASLRKRLPPGADRGSCELELPEGATVGDVLARLGIPPREAQMVLVDGLGCKDLDRPLAPGEVLSIFPALAGG